MSWMTCPIWISFFIFLSLCYLVIRDICFGLFAFERSGRGFGLTRKGGPWLNIELVTKKELGLVKSPKGQPYDSHELIRNPFQLIRVGKIKFYESWASYNPFPTSSSFIHARQLSFKTSSPRLVRRKNGDVDSITRAQAPRADSKIEAMRGW